MNLFPKEFPDNIPRILAGFIALNFGIYCMTVLIADLTIGRPSSTSVIGFGFIPIYTLIIAALCYGAGWVIRHGLALFIPPKVLSEKTNRVLLMLFFGSLTVAFFSGWGTVVWEEYQQRPRVIFDTGRVKLVSRSPQAIEKIAGNLVLSIYEEDQEKIQPVIWSGKEVNFDGDRNVLKIGRINGGELVPADLRKHDYIGRAYAVPLKIGGTDKEALGVAVRFRPTSHRGMFLAYDPDGKLVYQELLECHGLNGLLSLVRDGTGLEYFSLNLRHSKLYEFNQIQVKAN
jgi:hypothetical protein